MEVSISLQDSDFRGVWMGQLVERLTLDLSSGLDLRVMSSSPALGSTPRVEFNFKKKKSLTMIDG